MKLICQDVIDQFFDESDQDGTYQYYDIKEGYIATHKAENVYVVAISHDHTQFQVHSEERGALDSTDDAIANLNVYQLIQVYPKNKEGNHFTYKQFIGNRSIAAEASSLRIPPGVVHPTIVVDNDVYHLIKSNRQDLWLYTTEDRTKQITIFND